MKLNVMTVIQTLDEVIPTAENERFIAPWTTSSECNTVCIYDLPHVPRRYNYRNSKKPIL
jgi:hypothetical protein